MKEEILTLAQKRKKKRDMTALQMYEQLRRDNPELNRSAAERIVGREMARMGYDLTTRVGVHNVIARMTLEEGKTE